MFQKIVILKLNAEVEDLLYRSAELNEILKVEQNGIKIIKIYQIYNSKY